ncbi:hypothetical protein BB561_001176 [Smittium simulii]|uniref:Phospholipid:diacylglycerol acyltransferase n=1 Tax=Smittium simulii TaxID=133385 RepID=A0A2T9YVX5_9FUNG|nr:hypothetical protein BB561_001176 [Smittium simulii]
MKKQKKELRRNTQTENEESTYNNRTIINHNQNNNIIRNRKQSEKASKPTVSENSKAKKNLKHDLKHNVKSNSIFSFFKKITRAAAKFTKYDTAETYFHNSIVQSELKGKVTIDKRKRFWFVVGVVFGILATNVVVKKTDFNDIQFNQFQSYLNIKMSDIDFAYYLPEKKVFDDTFNQLLSFSKLDSFALNEPKIKGLFEPAKSIKKLENLQANYHVVMIPGIVTSGLESWCTDGCFSKYFRKRVWGTASMFKSLLFDAACWYNHMLLDEKTGLDPPDIKLRVVKGLESADYFMSGYWVWAKVIDNLSEIGYDNIMMHMASYDWRLSIPDLETRDSYYSLLKSHIEITKKISKKKVVVISHSMGSLVFSYFIKWVESSEFGNGGPKWVEEHVESWINAAGSMLGTSKAFAALLSGESGELIQPVTRNLLETYMSRQDRVFLFRNWGSTSSILPKGGNIIWGDKDFAPDNYIGTDELVFEKDNGVFVELYNKTSDKIEKSLSIEEALVLLKTNSNSSYTKKLKKNYNMGIFTKQKEFDEHKNDFSTFSNPLTFQLPNAPSMKLYNFYGVGHKTERKYRLTFNKKYDNITTNNSNIKLNRPKLDYVIDTDINDPNNTIHSGIKYSEGDGSVNLVSLGLMGSTLWKTKLYNPHNVSIVTREYAHNVKPFYYGLFEDPEICDHIGILGNHDFLKTVLRIVSGNHTTDDRFYSNIKLIGERIKNAII